jgi:hypothetical protein
MPKELEQKLMKEYKKRGLKGKALGHAVYGTLTNIEKRQGKTMQGKRKK